MKLRLRLALAALAVMVPMTLALIWFDHVAQHRAASQILLRVTLDQAERSLQACVANPAGWSHAMGPGPLGPGGRPPPADAPRPFPPPGGERRPPPPPGGGPPPFGEPPPGEPEGRHARPAHFFAYDSDFRAADPAAPVLPPSLTDPLRSGESFAVEPVPWLSDDVRVLLRTGAPAGPCAYVLATGSTDPSWGKLLPRTEFWLLPMLVALVAVVMAVGPVIRRIRKLEHDVTRSARATYTEPIESEGADEVGDLARAFDAARKEILGHLQAKEQRERALYDFIANTTHDVMIPLTVLQGHLASLRDAEARGAPADATVVAAAMTEAHYLGSLVHNLAVAARLDDTARALERHPVDLGALVARVRARHAPIARERGITLEAAVPPGPVTVSADVTLLEQAVSNVVYNAIVYNRPEGHVAVILEQSAEAFSLRVIDDGPGMSDEGRAHAFERGARGEEARSRAPAGQGLGLSITKRAADAHGYDVRLSPSEYGGLEVTLTGTTSPA